MQWECAAAFAKGNFEIDQKLGQHDLIKFYPVSITVAHKGEGGKRGLSDKAMLLIPASGNGKEPFAGAVLHKDGLYVEVENDDAFVNVSKKASMVAKKDMAQHWKTDLPTVNVRGRVSNKAARGQLGVAAYKAIIMDLMVHCETSTMVINDFMGGVGEVGIASLAVKVSPEASER